LPAVIIWHAVEECTGLFIKRKIFTMSDTEIKEVFDMMQHFITAGKALGFLLSWGLTMSVIVIPSVREPAFLKGRAAYKRLWLEIIPLACILAVTVFFTVVLEKKSVSVPMIGKSAMNIPIGVALGCVWLGLPVLFLAITGHFKTGEKSPVPFFAVWALASLINAAMQEYLVRGYLFSLLQKEYNLIVAIIVTTVLFTAMHGGAFKSGIIAILNIVTMSVSMSLLLVYTKGLIAPIVAHFIWNSAGGPVLGVVSLASDYPNIYNSTLSGNTLISGGKAKLEGSAVVLFVNLLFITLLQIRL
jgi:membrane protease YdiL (CAAX protease family)